MMCGCSPIVITRGGEDITSGTKAPAEGPRRAFARPRRCSPPYPTTAGAPMSIAVKRVATPEGGYFLWLDLAEGTDTVALLAEAKNEGVSFVAGPDFMIEGGDLTLDPQGDADAVWVFQMATTLTVGGPGAAAPQSIILIPPAQSKNVFWQVGSAATINAAGGGTSIASSGGTRRRTATD